MESPRIHPNSNYRYKNFQRNAATKVESNDYQPTVDNIEEAPKTPENESVEASTQAILEQSQEIELNDHALERSQEEFGQQEIDRVETDNHAPDLPKTNEITQEQEIDINSHASEKLHSEEYIPAEPTAEDIAQNPPLEISPDPYDPRQRVKILVQQFLNLDYSTHCKLNLALKTPSIVHAIKDQYGHVHRILFEYKPRLG